jgi:UDP-N-acetylglucosamine--N-acetylmuramyl-(pentapeptide) pyrophosphoryl-undecaprenol N-acetylglucosamine transferase
MPVGEEETEVRVVIAGGGTGGHLFPGLAVAREISKKSKGARILFVTGMRRMESEIIRRSGFEQASITVEGMKGKGWRGALVLLKLPWSLFQCLGIMHGFKPNLVFGVGGYSSGPVCLSAKILRIPSAVHEQNSYPGVTNRLLSRVVDRVFISFEESRGCFREGSVYFTGNPIRNEFLEATSQNRRDRDPGFTILAVGGSQGARAINDALVDAQLALRERGREVHVLHQTGHSDYERVLARYREEGLQGEVQAFILDMAEAYRRSDLVVSRAGAGAIFELAALGKPSILIPYPFAANHHQETNAKVLVDAGGAEMISQESLSGGTLAASLVRLMENPGILESMGAAARRMAVPGAAQDIANLLLDMIKP